MQIAKGTIYKDKHVTNSSMHEQDTKRHQDDFEEKLIMLGLSFWKMRIANKTK